jgi:hypothetical protein
LCPRRLPPFDQGSRRAAVSIRTVAAGFGRDYRLDLCVYCGGADRYLSGWALDDQTLLIKLKLFQCKLAFFISLRWLGGSNKLQAFFAESPVIFFRPKSGISQNQEANQTAGFSRTTGSYIHGLVPEFQPLFALIEIR